MIRESRNSDLSKVMKIWLNTNIKAHSFIGEEYWTGNFELVKGMMPQAELYVYEDIDAGIIEGFIGIMDDYIAGIFVDDKVQSKGIGKQLLNYVKDRKRSLTLSVYQKNERAIKFYLRENFKIQSENVDESTGEKEFVMTWQFENKETGVDYD